MSSALAGLTVGQAQLEHLSNSFATGLISDQTGLTIGQTLAVGTTEIPRSRPVYLRARVEWVGKKKSIAQLTRLYDVFVLLFG